MHRLLETQDGSMTVMSEKYGVSYHSKYGAIQESRHVFIEAGLYYAAVRKKQLNLIEYGMGTGLNVLMTFLEAQRYGWEIHYTAIEAYPLERELILQLHYPEQLEAMDAKTIFYDGIHADRWGEIHQLSGGFYFQKIKGHFEDVHLPAIADLIYYDAFAPNAQPELWEIPVLKNVCAALAPDGILVTYCAKGAFKRNLRSLGLKVESLQGPPGKREMTRAVLTEAVQEIRPD